MCSLVLHDLCTSPLPLQSKFSSDMHPHYIYSPRELSKWTRAVYEGIQPLDGATLDDLARLWLHEVHTRSVSLLFCVLRVSLPLCPSLSLVFPISVSE